MQISPSAALAVLYFQGIPECFDFSQAKKGKRPQLSLELLMLLAGEQVIYCCSWHGSVSKAMSLALAVFSCVLGTTKIPVSPEGTDPPSPTPALTRVGEMI